MLVLCFCVAALRSPSSGTVPGLISSSPLTDSLQTRSNPSPLLQKYSQLLKQSQHIQQQQQQHNNINHQLPPPPPQQQQQHGSLLLQKQLAHKSLISQRLSPPKTHLEDNVEPELPAETFEPPTCMVEPPSPEPPLNPDNQEPFSENLNPTTPSSPALSKQYPEPMGSPSLRQPMLSTLGKMLVTQ